MASSSNDEGMIMMVMMGIAVIAGLYFFIKKKGDGSGSGSGGTSMSTPQINQAPSASQQGQFSIGTEPQYTSVLPAINPNVGVPLDPFTIPGKASLPIISGAVVSTDPYLFTPQSAGMCQCNEATCCYYSPFYEKFSYEQLPGPETRVCQSVEFGDKLQACNTAVSGFQTHYAQEIKSSYARALAAHDMRIHLSNRPVKAALMAQRNRARAARIIGLR